LNCLARKASPLPTSNFLSSWNEYQLILNYDKSTIFYFYARSSLSGAVRKISRERLIVTWTSRPLTGRRFTVQKTASELERFKR
jgi:hypothetical protein